MAAVFRLQAGGPAPRQQSQTTCGSACLTIARMLVNPDFARWIEMGVDGASRDDEVGDGYSEGQRFAAYEQVVAARTNALVGAGGRLQLPWPRALGTPPWGARNEIEYGASDPAADYELAWLRPRGRSGLERAHERLAARVRRGRPALLYIGDVWLPRHVVLVMAPATGSALEVYEPAAGGVEHLLKDRFVTRHLGLAGWDVPWAAVWDGSAG